MKEAREAAEKQLDEEGAAEAETTEEGAEGEAKEGDDASGKIAEYTALLVRFPPGRWTLESPEKIRHRRVILGIPPSQEDIEFLEVFEQWKGAYKMWRKAQKAQDEADAKAKQDARTAGRR